MSIGTLKLAKSQASGVKGTDEYRLIYHPFANHIKFVIAHISVDRQTSCWSIQTSYECATVYIRLMANIWQLIEDMMYPDVVEMLANITKEDIIYVGTNSFASENLDE